MHSLPFLITIASAIAVPLQLTSLITLRTVNLPPGGGGNTPPPPPYGPLILEEWDSMNTLLQSWTLPCTLPGLSTESWTEGYLSPRYPWEDQVWVLCRNVPVNSSLSTNPAPVSLVSLDEQGTVSTWAEETFYANGTNAVNLIPYWDEVQGLNVFYMLGGGTPPGNGPSSGPTKPAQARIRVDTGQGVPPDVQGGLLSSVTGVTINHLRILNHTLFGLGSYGTSTTSLPVAYRIGSLGILPEAARTPTTTMPLVSPVLSVWTDPHGSSWWHTALNRTGYLGHTENGMLQEFLLPPSVSSGTLGGVSWSIATGRQEGTEFAVYLTNKSHIVKNTLNGLKSGLPYQPVLQTPPGWRYLSAHARNPSLPTPSATATATATASSSSSASASTTATPTSSTSTSSSPSSSASPSATACPTATGTSSPSSTSTPTASPNTQTSAGASPSNSPSTTPSPSFTPSTTPSNGSVPLSPDANQAQPSLTIGEETGIGLGSIAAFSIVGLALVYFHPTLKRLYIRQFGASSKGVKKGVSFRNPVSSDVPISISHNPTVLVQQRLEQLKDLQKQLSVKEINQTSGKSSSGYLGGLKKEFAPIVSGSSV